MTKTILSLILAMVMVVGCGEKHQTLKEKAEGGDAEAQSMLGFEYETGLGGRRDLKEAVKWYRNVGVALSD